MPSEGVAQERLGELTATQRTLVESFQAFVREESENTNNGSGPQNQEKEELHPLQIIFLIAFATDITLLYVILLDVFPNIPENRGVVFLLQKVLPALGGTLAVSYFKRLRSWLFELSKDRRIGMAFVALLGVLVIAVAPIYSVYVSVTPPNTTVKYVRIDRRNFTVEPEPEPVHFDQTGNFLLVPAPRAYDVELQDGSNPPFIYHIGVGRALKGTLVRTLWPSFKKLFTPLSLPAAYQVDISFNNDQSGQLYIYGDVYGDGEFRLNQTNKEHPWNAKLAPVTASVPDVAIACPSQRGCWQKKIELNQDVLVLPQGKYTFTKSNNGCILQATWTITGNSRHELIYKKPGVQALTKECK